MVSSFHSHHSKEGRSVNSVAVVPGGIEALSGGDDAQVWLAIRAFVLQIGLGMSAPGVKWWFGDFSLKDTCCNHLKHVAFSTPKQREPTIYKAMFRCMKEGSLFVVLRIGRFGDFSPLFSWRVHRLSRSTPRIQTTKQGKLSQKQMRPSRSRALSTTHAAFSSAHKHTQPAVEMDPLVRQAFERHRASRRYDFHCSASRGDKTGTLAAMNLTPGLGILAGGGEGSQEAGGIQISLFQRGSLLESD